jgi:hypothetical protein
MIRLAACLGVLACVSACTEKEGYSGMGKKPIYIPFSQLDSIKNLPPQPVQSTGTIFYKGNLFFLMENLKGIHVFDVSDSTNIVPVTFIQIPAINDFSIRSHFLYADNGSNLVTIDISDVTNVVVKGKIVRAFQPVLFPPLYRGPFECVDESKGVVIAWRDTFFTNTYCNSL